MPQLADIGIIGAGLSGSLTVINLLKHSTKSLQIVVFEKDAKRTGRGVAYSNDYVYQPLNVNVEGMSLYEYESLHFYSWILENIPAENIAEDFSPRSFVSRHWFGDYLSSELRRSINSQSKHKVTFVHDEVTHVESDNSNIQATTLSGQHFEFQKLILALGNFLPAAIPSEDLNYINHPGYEANPWRDGLLDDIEAAEKVLFLGSGLTTVDLLINLKLLGHTSQVYVLSRNGRLPCVQKETPHKIVEWKPEEWSLGILQLLRNLRHKIHQAVTHGFDWRNVIDSLRPHTPLIWQSLSQDDKKVFLQRLRIYWETHRHRMTQSSHDFLQESFSDKKTALLSGKVKNIVLRKTGFLVAYKHKDTRSMRSIFVHRIINCTGPESNYRNIDQPLVKDMLYNGLVTQDPTSLGLMCDRDGHLMDGNNKSQNNLFALGPLRRGTEWESTALREIRHQAVILAMHLLEPMKQELTSV